MIKFILKISPLVLLLVLQGCSKDYCCNIPGTDAIAGYCSDGLSDNEYDCTEEGNSSEWTEGIDAVAGTNECYSDQEECEAACSNLFVDEGGQCQEGKE